MVIEGTLFWLILNTFLRLFDNVRAGVKVEDKVFKGRRKGKGKEGRKGLSQLIYLKKSFNIRYFGIVFYKFNLKNTLKKVKKRSILKMIDI